MTFSSFERLPVTLPHLPDFPDGCVVRTNDARQLLPFCLIAPHLGMFADPHAKELLITPKGVRIVWQLAEKLSVAVMAYSARLSSERSGSRRICYGPFWTG